MDRFDEMRTKGINTNDATATSSDILEGKTAYAQGRRIIGELVPSSGNPGVISDIYSWCAQKGAVIPEEQTVENLLECVKSISEIVSFTVNFDTAGGDLIQSQTVVYGHTITEVTPVYENHTFGGWLLAGEPFDIDEPIKQNCTLVAKWDGMPNEVYLMEAGTSSNDVARAYGAYQRLGNSASSSYTRDKILSITFFANPEQVETGYVASWDVSLNRDGSAMAYIYANTQNSGYYDLYIAGALKFILPANLRQFFQNYTACTNINGLHLFDTSNVTNMALMFQKCSSLTNVDVSGFDTSNVTNMSTMFGTCSSLTNVDVSNFDTGKMTSSSLMFQYCENLLSFDGSNFYRNPTIPKFDIQGMFSQCKKIRKINLSKLDIGAVTVLTQAFFYCQNLEVLDIRNMTFDSVTSSSQAFAWIPNTCVIYVKNADVEAYIRSLNFAGIIRVVG